MNFTQIYNGMIGRDFIKAFNDNFTIADHSLLQLLAAMIYKINSTDIKEFKVIDNVVSYTLEEAPTEGEDTREWIPVDITKWGNIAGDINDQVDLMTILQDKAAVSTVQTLNSLVATLRQDFDQTAAQVADNTTRLNTATNNITDILDALLEKVNSTNIKAIRLNNAVFQWSPDGRTWYEQPTVSSIAWGHITGDITTQEDLMFYFNEINTNFSELDTAITSIRNNISSLSDMYDVLEDAFNNHLIDFENYKNTITNALSEIRTIANTSETHAQEAKDDLQDHLEDYNNPHHITKNTILLDNVDNTADINKPLSNPQKQYVDNQIDQVKQEIVDRSGLVASSGVANTLFVGNSTDYTDVGSKIGVLAFIIDDSMIVTTCTLFSSSITTFDLYKNGTIVTPTSSMSTTKIYTEIPKDGAIYTVRVTVDGVTTEYDIDLKFTTSNEIDIDELIEGGND